jgi:hypothetical protein
MDNHYTKINHKLNKKIIICKEYKFQLLSVNKKYVVLWILVHNVHLAMLHSPDFEMASVFVRCDV